MSAVKGVTNLRRILRTAEPAIKADITTALNEGARAIMWDAMALVPVNTGKTRANIRIGRARDGLQVKIGLFGAGAGRNGAWYARFVHNGTVKIPADPWLFIAYEQNVAFVETGVAEAVRVALGSIIGG